MPSSDCFASTCNVVLTSSVQINVDGVHNVVIWGNHSSTQYADVNHGVVEHNSHKTSVRDAIKDDHWLQSEFITAVQQRGGAVIKARKLSSAASAANAICNHIHDWVLGTPQVRSCSSSCLVLLLRRRRLLSLALRCLHALMIFCGYAQGEYVSMAVPSDGSYGVPVDLIYSFPVTCHEGKWKIVQGLEISDFSRKKMEETTKELVDEKTQASEFLH
jgi:malate dehydrogenase